MDLPSSKTDRDNQPVTNITNATTIMTNNKQHHHHEDSTAADMNHLRRSGTREADNDEDEEDDDTTQHSHQHQKAKLVQRRDGQFPGSFAGTLRGQTKAHVVPWYRRREYFTQGWLDACIWRAAFIELVATANILYITGQYSITINQLGAQLAVPAFVGIFNTILLSIFIYATAPASGGHLNPMITFTTFLCGLCPAPRAVAYIVCQTIGAGLAGGYLRGSWGYDRAAAVQGTGCFFDPATLSLGQVVLTEFCSSKILLFLAFGTGLDPRQAAIFGPQLGPFMVGLSLGVVTAATTGTAQGYGGASVNPARCFAFSIARGSFDYHWIWWAAPAAAGIFSAMVYNFAPPWHAERKTRWGPADENIEP